MTTASGDEGLGNKQRALRTEQHPCAKVEFRHNHLRNGGLKDATTYGLDVAKRVFKCTESTRRQVIVNRRFGRDH
jgi:hypothetical protein